MGVEPNLQLEADDILIKNTTVMLQSECDFRSGENRSPTPYRDQMGSVGEQPLGMDGEVMISPVWIVDNEDEIGGAGLDQASDEEEQIFTMID